MKKTGKSKRKGRMGFVIITLLLVGLLVLLVMRPRGSEMEAPEEVVFAVNTTTAVLGAIADYFEINGEVESTSSVDVYADVQGILTRLHVSLGDYVRDGQLIAEVDPSRPGMVYSLSPVKARVSGTITALPLDRGDAVGPAAPVAVISDLARLQVAAAIPERFVSRIRVGMKARIKLEARPDFSIPLRVDEIDPVVDPASRTMGITMAIPSRYSDVKAGMYAEIRLTTDEKNQVVKVSTDTLLRRLGETFVYIVDGDTAHKRIVVPGITQQGVAEIVDGLEAGEELVYQGQSLLEDGVKVRVVQNVPVISP